MIRQISAAAIVAASVAAAPAALGAGTANTPEVISGGVGIGNRQDMMDQFKDYNLHLGFATPDGAFLADVGVTIRDKSGKVVWSGTSQGPLLFAQLQPGTYTVETNFEGQTQKRSVNVGKRPGSMHYVRLATGSREQNASVGSSPRRASDPASK